MEVTRFTIKSIRLFHNTIEIPFVTERDLFFRLLTISNVSAFETTLKFSVRLRLQGIILIKLDFFLFFCV